MYQISLDNNQYCQVGIPDNLTKADAQDLKDMFALIVRRLDRALE